MIFGLALSTLLIILTTTSYCLIGNSVNSIFGTTLSALFVIIGILSQIKQEILNKKIIECNIFVNRNQESIINGY